jgi:GntP family gluconate:H+ symporter
MKLLPWGADMSRSLISRLALVVLFVFCVAICIWQPAGAQTTSSGPAEVSPAAETAVDGSAGETRTAAESNATETTATSEQAADTSPALSQTELYWAFGALIAGIVTVLGLIIVAKVNAFIALIVAAMVVSMMGPESPMIDGTIMDNMTRVGAAFGVTAGKIGIVIALASVIGTCMLDSGAADRIVRTFVRLLGEKRASTALMGSGFLLAIPVFFDTVFYLLVPLARSLFRRTGKNYLLYLMAICAGGAITHALVPPTPGPLAVAAKLNVDLGVMILVGGLISVPAAIAGLIYSKLIARWMPIEMRSLGTEPEREPLQDEELPGLIESLLPVVLPVLLISMNTLVEALLKAGQASATPDVARIDLLQNIHAYTAILGNANLALLISTVIAMFTLVRKRALDKTEMARIVEASLMSGGLIILITSGGGAFGGMLQTAKVGDAIQQVFAGEGSSGVVLLVVGFGIATVMKIAQGSGTVAMITTAGMLVSAANPQALGCDPVYLATAIGAGATCGSWMNDSGFWIVAKMGGLTEYETLKSWSVLLIVLGVTAFAVTLLAAHFIPFPFGQGM